MSPPLLPPFAVLPKGLRVSPPPLPRLRLTVLKTHPPIYYTLAEAATTSFTTTTTATTHTTTSTTTTSTTTTTTFSPASSTTTTPPSSSFSSSYQSYPRIRYTTHSKLNFNSIPETPFSQFPHLFPISTGVWTLTSSGIPNHFAVVDAKTGYNMASQSYTIDIPLCPHSLLDFTNLNNWNYNTTAWSTLGLGPIGFTLNGVAIRGPITEDLEDCSHSRYHYDT